jgi:hypothetical protein
MIERNIEFEAQLINEMLDFTSIGRSKLILGAEKVDCARRCAAQWKWWRRPSQNNSSV